MFKIKHGLRTETLAEWGISSGTLIRRTQDADSLTFSTRDAFGAGLPFDWGDKIELFWNSTRVFSGKLTRTPRVLRRNFQTAQFEAKNHWADLDEAPATQVWTDKDGTKRTGRFAAGTVDAGESIADTAEVISELVSLASGMGIEIAMGALLNGIKVPVAEFQDRSIGDILRDVLRWHPDAVTWTNYETGTPTLNIRRRGSLSGLTLSAQNIPATSLDIVSRPDLIPANVHCLFETLKFDEDAQVYKSLIVPKSYPTGSGIGPRSVVQTFDLGGSPTGSGKGQSNRPRPTCHVQRIKSRRVPPPGSTNADDAGSDAQDPRRFIIWNSPGIGRAARHFGTNKIRNILKLWAAPVNLTVFGTLVDIADPFNVKVDVPDESDPDPDPMWTDESFDPEDISDDPEDWPYYLVKGTLEDWMRKKATPLECKATFAIKEADLNDLPELTETDRVEKRRLRDCFSLGDVDEVSGKVRYLFASATWQITGTDCPTGVYSRLVGYGGEQQPDPDADDPSEDFEDLPREIYEASSELHWEGTFSFRGEAPALDARPGRKLNLTHSSRPEWGGMNALISESRLDLKTFETELAFGPPKFLSGADFRELARASSRNAATALPPTARQSGGGGGGGGGPENLPKGDQSHGGFAAPENKTELTPPKAPDSPHPWRVTAEKTEGGVLKISVYPAFLGGLIPKIDGTPLGGPSPPSFEIAALGAFHVVATGTETPVSEQMWNEKYRLIGAFITGDIVLTCVETMPADDQAPEINHDTGEQSKAGKFNLEIARVNNGVIEQLRFLNMGHRFCPASGRTFPAEG